MAKYPWDLAKIKLLKRACGTYATYAGAAEYLKIPVDTVRREILRRGWSLKKKVKISSAESLTNDGKMAVMEAKLSECGKKYKHALGVIGSQERMMNALMKMDKNNNRPVVQSGPRKNHDAHEACAIAVFNDWHLGQFIYPGTVGGLNEFDVQIGIRRIRKSFINLIRLVGIERNLVGIDKLVVCFLGDMISGNIHEDLRETNELTAEEASILAEEEIVAGLEYILKYGKFKGEILCVMKQGNHGRSTEKPRVAMAHRYSYELNMYRHVAKYLRARKQLKFLISDNYDDIIDIYGVKIRVHHGDRIRGGGGIGGVTAPILRAIAKWPHVDLSIQGHLHQHLVHDKFIISGCLCGIDTFGKNVSFASFEPPSQTLIFIDSKLKRVTHARRIHCE